MNLDSFFQGYDSTPNTYIACQGKYFCWEVVFFLLVHTYLLIWISSLGPVPGTYQDFWRMLWRENVTTVVMLTRLVEHGRVYNVLLFFHQYLFALLGGKRYSHVERVGPEGFTSRVSEPGQRNRNL